MAISFTDLGGVTLSCMAIALLYWAGTNNLILDVQSGSSPTWICAHARNNDIRHIWYFAVAVCPAQLSPKTHKGRVFSRSKIVQLLQALT